MRKHDSGRLWGEDKDYYRHLSDEQVLERFWYPLLAEDVVYDPVYSAAQWSGFKPPRRRSPGAAFTRTPRLRSRREGRARELRVGGAIAAPPRDRGERTEENALHRRRRLAEHDHVAELPRGQRELQ